jgi:hypothetical protein
VAGRTRCDGGDPGKAFVFIGPTLGVEEVAERVCAVCLPPAAEGNVYRAGIERPDAIAIIDGFFDRVPAVWHKEILWALSQGIRVLGAASMGALRAAELATLFEASRAGVLTGATADRLQHLAKGLYYPDRTYHSRSIAVTQGKGQTLDAARASGLMEATEYTTPRRWSCPA